MQTSFLQVPLTDDPVTAPSPEPSSCQRSEGRHESEMASDAECSGECRTAAVCRRSVSPGASSTVSCAPVNAGNRISRSEVSATDSNSRQLEIEVSDTDGTLCDTDAQRLNVNDLPDEVLIKIFSHMSFSELVDVIQKVCTRWRRLSQDLELWADKEYQIRAWSERDSDRCAGGTTDLEAVRALCAAPGLRSVCLRRGASARVFRALCDNCCRLCVLRLHVTQKLSYSVLSKLVEKCSRIHTLRIPSELLKSARFSEVVSRLQDLRALELVLRFTRSGPALRPLADGCPRLAEVDFSFSSVDLDDLRYFLNAKRNTLKSIRIKWTMGGRKCVVPLLTVCADSLERLQLYGFDVPRDEARRAFSALGSLRNLRELKMALIKPAPPGTAALAFASGGLSRLRLLDLRGGYGLDDGVVVAASHGCPDLRQLDVRGCHLLTDAAFSQVHRLQLLEILDVSRCKCLGGALVPYLAGLPRLHTLLMENMEFPKLQPGLSSILQLSSVRCLTLNHSLVTGVPFEKFPGNLVSLRQLNVAWCRGSLKAMDGLLEQMPDLKICGRVEADKLASTDAIHDSDAELLEQENEVIAGFVMRLNRMITVGRVAKMVAVMVSLALVMRVITLFGMKAVYLFSF